MCVCVCVLGADDEYYARACTGSREKFAQRFVNVSLD